MYNTINTSLINDVSIERVGEVTRTRQMSPVAGVGKDEKQRTRLFQVSGMTCSACVSNIERALMSLEGVISVSISLLAERAEVVFDESVIQPADIRERILDLGFEAELLVDINELDTVEFIIHGMTCASCVGSIETSLGNGDGIVSVEVSLMTEKALIRYDSCKIGPRDILSRIQDLGFDAFLLDNQSNLQLEALERTKEILLWKRLFLQSLFFMIPEFLIGHLLPNFEWFRNIFYHPSAIPGLYVISLVELMLTLPAQFVVGQRFYAASWKGLKHGSATMDLLISVSTSFAFAFSLFAMIYAMIYPEMFQDQPPMTFFDTSTMLITFVVLGKYLENIAKGKTSTALAKLYGLKPSYATIVLDDGRKEEKVGVEYLQKGDIIKILPGDKIPADGVILSGSSTIDESVITGESVPVLKQEGSQVIGGTINSSSNQSQVDLNQEDSDMKQGTLFVRVTKVGKHSTLAQIIKLVENAQTTKPQIQSFADLVSTYFVPSILVLGFATFIAWICILSSDGSHHYRSMLFMSHSYASAETTTNSMAPPALVALFIALKISISVIVVACPCALGLATPTAIMVGTGVCAQLGVFIKNGQAFEAARSVKSIVLDKTGTLTQGQMSVISEFHVTSKSGSGRDDEWKRLFYSIAALTESQSEHPLAFAVTKKSHEVLDGVPSLSSGFLHNLSDGTLNFETDKVPLDLKLEDFASQTGQGVKSTIQALPGLKFRFAIGTLEFLMAEKFYVPHEKSPSRAALDQFCLGAFHCGHSVIYACLDLVTPTSSKFCLFYALSIADSIRPEARLAVQALQEFHGLDVYLVTGDQVEAALHCASVCGIPRENVFARVSPLGKKEMVSALQTRTLDEFRERWSHPRSSPVTANFTGTYPPGFWTRLMNAFSYGRREASYKLASDDSQYSGKQVVAMVGDGINDSPALAQADIGIALCSGTEIAIEASDMVLLNNQHNTSAQDSLFKNHKKSRISRLFSPRRRKSVAGKDISNLLLLPTAIDLSKTIYRRIIYNFAWATLYNLVSLPVAMGFFIPFGIVLHPIVAAGLMAISSISVVLSSLCLRFYKAKDWRSYVSGDDQEYMDMTLSV